MNYKKLLDNFNQAFMELTEGFDENKLSCLEKYEKALNEIETFMFGKRKLGEDQIEKVPVAERRSKEDKMEKKIYFKIGDKVEYDYDGEITAIGIILEKKRDKFFVKTFGPAPGTKFIPFPLTNSFKSGWILRSKIKKKLEKIR